MKNKKESICRKCATNFDNSFAAGWKSEDPGAYKQLSKTL
jgi:hypothetical protein